MNDITLPSHRRALGIAAAVAAGVCLATGGVGLRWLEAATGWQVLVYRGGALAVVIGLWTVFQYRADTLNAYRRIGIQGAVAAIAIGATAVFYVFAILNTTVANTVVILSLSPLVSAALAWAILRETLSRSTLAALLVAVTGVVVMCADGLQAGGMLGIVIALGAVSCFSVFIVMARAGRAVDMLPAIALSGLVSAAVGLFMSSSIVISYGDAVIGVALGVVQLGAGYALITLATREIPAALVALLTLSELVFAPLFVWLAIGEVPTSLAALGGTLVVMAVVFQAWRALAEVRG